MDTTKTFNHKFVNLKELQTKNENGMRYYITPDGSAFPSVTSVIGKYYGGWVHAWRKKVGEEVANRISRTASNRGTAIHSLCEKYLRNEEPTTKMPINLEMFRTMIPAINRIDNIYSIEEPLYSYNMKTAGRVDCIGQFDGVDSIIDFKTSKRKKELEDIESYFVQASMYSLMFEEMTGIACKQLVVIIGVDFESPCVHVQSRGPYLNKVLEVLKHFKKVTSPSF